MKKILFLPIIALFTIIFTNNTYAQTDPGVNENCPVDMQGTGCWRCAWNDSIGRCAETTDADTVSCNFGYSPNGERDFTQGYVGSDIDNLCADKTFEQCANQEVITACVPYTGTQYHYCNRSNLCAPCDLDPDTPLENCPGNILPPWTNIEMCRPNCERDTIPGEGINECELIENANCKSACGSGEEEYFMNCPGNGLRCCSAKKIPAYLCDIGGEPQEQIKTAIGCIPIGKPEDTAAFLLRWSLGVAGGIAILVFIAAGFQFTISSGDPEKISSAKEMLMAGLVGTCMIILSIVLLRVIGFSILGIF